MSTDKLTFVAIDVETATAERNSICAVGIVTVVNGTIAEKYYSLVQPPGNQYNIYTVRVHGITTRDTVHAPTFAEIYPEIKRRLQNQTVVAHNARSMEVHCIARSMEMCGITDDLNITWIDTLDECNRQKLDKACAELGIPLDHYHDALSDATACAQLHLAYVKSDKPAAPVIKDYPVYHRRVRQSLRPEHDHPDNPFIGKRITITGQFATWPERDDLCDLLECVGAKISATVLKSTDILVAGIGAGDRKMQQMQTRLDEDPHTQILNENGLIEMLSRCGMSYRKVDLPIADKHSLTDTLTLSRCIRYSESDNNNNQ